jgi:hypothetical protein
MRTSRYLTIVAVAATLLATPGIAAADPGTSAVNVLTYGSLGGPNVAVGDSESAPLKAGTGGAKFMSTAGGTTGITCAVSSFGGAVTGNPASPGVATGTLTTQSFSSCTDTISLATVKSVTVNNLPFTINVNSTTKAVTVTGTVQTTVVLSSPIGQINCVYQANNLTVTGSADNADNSIKFVNQQFNRTQGTNLCFATAFFSANYAPVTGPGGAVFVN